MYRTNEELIWLCSSGYSFPSNAISITEVILHQIRWEDAHEWRVG
jgi:hypothetical protein